MLSFKEYVVRRDEASFNPIPTGGGGLLRAATGVLASPIAVAAGATELGPTYRNWATGNPLGTNISRGYKAFEQSRDWLLNLAKTNDKWREYLSGVLDSAERYIQAQKPTEIAGVTMGRTAGMASKLAAPFAALLKSAWTSLQNVAHTVFDIDPGIKNQAGEKVQSMLQGLDIIPKEQALNRIEEFRSVLHAGEGADAIDYDARMHKPFFGR